MKMTKTKLYMAGISISLALALAACGDTAGVAQADSMNVLSSSKNKIETRGTFTLAPYNPEVQSISHNSATIAWDYDLNMTNRDFDGFYVHIAKLAPGTTQADIDALHKTDWNTYFDCHKAEIRKKGDTIYNETLLTGGVFDEHNMTVDKLEANTTYAFIPNSYMNYGVGGGSLKRDLVCSSVVVATTLPTPPCLEVTAFSHISESTPECNTNNDCPPVDDCNGLPKHSKAYKTSRCHTTETTTYGAHPTWCFDKDDQGAPAWDGAELSRQTWDIELPDLNGGFGDWGPATVLSPNDPTDDTFDSERDHRDCDEEIVEDGKYKYTLKAYKGEGDATVWSADATAEITVTSEAPELDCTCCDK